MDFHRSVIPALGILMLSACGPKMEARSMAGRVVFVENKDTRTFTITKMVANDSESWSCTDTSSHTLAPGESATTTFITCGDVASLRVVTDRGTRTFSWN